MSLESDPPVDPNNPPTDSLADSLPADPPADPSADPNPPADPSVEPSQAASEDPPSDPPADPAPPADPPASPQERVVPAADGYTLPEGAPEVLGQFAHDNDMTQEQLEGTMRFFNSWMEGSEAATKTAVEAEGQALVKSWGKESESNLGLVRRALSQNDPDGSMKELLNNTGFGNHPVVLKFFLKLGMSMKEGGFLRNQVNKPTSGRSSAAQTLFGSSHPSAN